MGSVIRSLLNNLVDPHHIGVLNSVIGVVEMLSIMIAAPTIFQSLRLGLNLGGLWIGLPFMWAAAIISISTGIVWLIRLPASGKGSASSDPS